VAPRQNTADTMEIVDKAPTSPISPTKSAKAETILQESSTLQPPIMFAGEIIDVYIPYNPKAIAKVKSLPQSKWNKRKKCWNVHSTPENIQKLKEFWGKYKKRSIFGEKKIEKTNKRFGYKYVIHNGNQ
jgi:hypothetical protein